MSRSLYRRILPPPASSFFLFGARGVGKSTWARQQLAAAATIDLLDERRFHELGSDPARFADELRVLPEGSLCVVDEIQRLPHLLNEVHRLIEERGLRFGLLGSSARKLKTAGTNLLAGRAIRRTLFPLVPEELGRDFALDDVLRHGSIPLIHAAADRRATLEAYVQLYVREEIRAEALVKNLPGFLRFLPVAALAHGQAINVAAIARDAGAARSTVAGYLEILEDTLLAARLQPFPLKLRVRERAHPKLYWIDPGLVRAVKRRFGPVADEERGPLLEGYVLTLVAAYHEKAPLFDEIGYWSPAEARDVEVDFLLRRDREHLAIEVKSRTRLEESMLRGLKAVADLEGLARRILVYRGARRLLTREGIEVWPFEAFSAALAGGGLWP